LSRIVAACYVFGIACVLLVGDMDAESVQDAIWLALALKMMDDTGKR
jgi:hypothetical protein